MLNVKDDEYGNARSVSYTHLEPFHIRFSDSDIASLIMIIKEI